MMKTAAIAWVMVLCSLPLAQKVGWSTGYLSGWADIAATDIKWNAYTHMCVFSTVPDDNGGCAISMGLTDNSIRAAITEGHKYKVRLLLCIGGAGTGTQFVNATANAAVRATFIRNIIAQMQKYGFDGIDMDWEEVNGKESQYVAIHKELRAELDKITPRPLLTVAIANWMFSSVMSGICSSMDQMNNMSYWTNIIDSNGRVSETAIANDMQALVGKGVPKKVLGVGMGFDYEEIGSTGG